MVFNENEPDAAPPAETAPPAAPGKGEMRRVKLTIVK
jgi:hypothetical protein